MIIWLLNGDVAFAYDLKKSILSALGGEKKGKVEVFHTEAPFWEWVARAKKDSSKKPHLVLMDAHLPDADGLDLYCRLCREEPETARIVTFLSSMNYSSFCDFFDSKDLDCPPFIQKMNAVDEVCKWIKGQKTLPPPSIPKSIPYPRWQRARQGLEESLKKMGDRYYTSGIKEEGEADWIRLFNGVAASAGQLGFKEVADQAVYVAGLMQQKVPAGLMRLRKEIKGLMALAEKRLKGKEK